MIRLRAIWDKTFTDWRYRIVLHAGFWFFYFFFWLTESLMIEITFEQHFLVTLMGAIFSWFLFYPLVYVIIPLFRAKKWLNTILLCLLYYLIAIFLRTYHLSLVIQWYNLHNTQVAGADFWHNLYERQYSFMALTTRFFSSITSFISIIYIPLTLKFMRYAYQFNQRQSFMQRENARLQLDTLKAQINPHFFFNTLNNLQSFIVHNEKDKSVELLGRLANFMRSSIYDGGQELITIKQETDMIKNYVAIERVRFSEAADINVDIADAFPDYMTPPFMLLPFIENAFKHGSAVNEADILIIINLRHTAENIVLETCNSYNFDEKDHKAGIGLQNVRIRLEHYFPGRFELNIDKTDKFFKIYLEIKK